MSRTEHKDYLSAVAAIGCLICNRPAQVHHIRAGQGIGQKASDYLTIPLCPDHHTNGGHGVAIHAGKKAFEGLYGSEMHLLAQTIENVFKRARLE